VTGSSRTWWGDRAARLYTETYAENYRSHDEALSPRDAGIRLSSWLHGICEQFTREIDVLDLGCGTGRYFHALTRVRRLVGIDVSRPMLERARQPAGDVDRTRLMLIEADFLIHEFDPESFDLVYAIGVLGEHSPFDFATVERVSRWLKPGGRFAFTTVHPQSPSVAVTFRRSVAHALVRSPIVPDALRRRIQNRLMSGGLYADENRVREVLEASRFAVESIEPFHSDVHQHVRAVAMRLA
jgi:SAM-dependent methyltransferase